MFSLLNITRGSLPFKTCVQGILIMLNLYNYKHYSVYNTHDSVVTNMPIFRQKCFTLLLLYIKSLTIVPYVINQHEC